MIPVSETPVRRFLVRAQVGEPNKKARSDVGLFYFRGYLDPSAMSLDYPTPRSRTGRCAS
jgi:hypothetical protein